MNTIAATTYHEPAHDIEYLRHAAPRQDVNPDAGFQQFALQVLNLLMYGGFAIVATVLAFVNFWPAGVVLALFLAWRGFAPSQERA